MGIESAQATAVVLEKLKMGNEALRNAQRGYSLRDVESVLADMDDAREHEEAVRAMIEGSLSAEDDEVCEAELAALRDDQSTVFAAAAAAPPAAPESGGGEVKKGGALKGWGDKVAAMKAKAAQARSKT